MSKTTTEFIFYFSTDLDIGLEFIIEFKNSQKELENIIYSEDFYTLYTEPLESIYGVHDVSGIGYTTYEVAPNKILELLAQWKQNFIKAGLKPKDWYINTLFNECED